MKGIDFLCVPTLNAPPPDTLKTMQSHDVVESVRTIPARVPMAHAISKRIVLFSDMWVGVYVREICVQCGRCVHWNPSTLRLQLQKQTGAIQCGSSKRQRQRQWHRRESTWLLRFSSKKERKNHRSRLLQPCKEEELGFEAHGKRRLPSICIFF